MAILEGQERDLSRQIRQKWFSVFTYRTTETYTLSANSCWQQLTHGWGMTTRGNDSIRVQQKSKYVTMSCVMLREWMMGVSYQVISIYRSVLHAVSQWASQICDPA